jgi:hypothetical protein
MTSFAIEFTLVGCHSRVPNFCPAHSERLPSKRTSEFALLSCLHVTHETRFFSFDPFCLLSLKTVSAISENPLIVSAFLWAFFLSQKILPFVSAFLYFILESPFIALIGACFRHFSCQISVKISPSARPDLRVCSFDGRMNTREAGDSSRFWTLSFWRVLLAVFLLSSVVLYFRSLDRLHPLKLLEL